MNPQAFKPIGIYDSGVGGLSVLDVLAARFPGEHFVYLGDTANMPYGNRSRAELERFVDHNVRWLAGEWGIKLVVAACNTSSPVLLSEPFLGLAGVPKIGVIDPICRWLAVQDYQRVGLMATSATLRSEAYSKTLLGLNPRIKLIPIDGRDLASRVEAGRIEGREFERFLLVCLEPALSQGLDALILGCTHYPLALAGFKRVLPAGLEILDPAVLMGDAVEQVLAGGGLKSPECLGGTVTYAVTGEPEAFEQASRRLPLRHLTVRPVQRVGVAPSPHHAPYTYSAQK